MCCVNTIRHTLCSSANSVCKLLGSPKCRIPPAKFTHYFSYFGRLLGTRGAANFTVDYFHRIHRQRVCLWSRSFGFSSGYKFEDVAVLVARHPKCCEVKGQLLSL